MTLIEFIQTSVLAIIQGLTEYLPVSSSGHLILPRVLFGWAEPGLVFDVAVHVGSLLAVCIYFRAQLIELTKAWLSSIFGGEKSVESRLSWLLIMATIPAGLAGLFLEDLIEEYGRSLLLLACTSIVFGLLLEVGDRSSKKNVEMEQITWKTALVIGFAQVFALIPGTSRSGATMTAGLFMNLSRHAAAQFSFLMAIPIIAASGALQGVEFYQMEASASDWLVLLYGVALSAVVSFACIHLFLKLIERIGFMPFAIYRVLLGVVLLAVYWAS